MESREHQAWREGAVYGTTVRDRLARAGKFGSLKQCLYYPPPPHLPGVPSPMPHRIYAARFYSSIYYYLPVCFQTAMTFRPLH